MVTKWSVSFDIGRALGRVGKPLPKRKNYSIVREYQEQGHSVGLWERSFGKEPNGLI